MFRDPLGRLTEFAEPRLLKWPWVAVVTALQTWLNVSGGALNLAQLDILTKLQFDVLEMTPPKF